MVCDYLFWFIFFNISMWNAATVEFYGLCVEAVNQSEAGFYERKDMGEHD